MFEPANRSEDTKLYLEKMCEAFSKNEAYASLFFNKPTLPAEKKITTVFYVKKEGPSRGMGAGTQWPPW